MKYCSTCGATVHREVPDGDDRPRHVCRACETVHYENPRTVVGCVVEHEGSLLLCRRAIEPAHGRWTLPAGFLEQGESLLEGARRETREEAGAEVAIHAPFAHLDLAHISQLYALFHATIPDGRFEAGPESLEVALFPYDELPWDELAFPVIDIALRYLLEDRAGGAHHVHYGRLVWRGTGSRYDAAHYDVEDLLRLPHGAPPG